MRLLDITSFELCSRGQFVFREVGYAILSQRWVGQGIPFEQLKNHVAELRTDREPSSTPQLEKIRGACQVARQQDIKWMWIDTCRINKTSTVEETESKTPCLNGTATPACASRTSTTRRKNTGAPTKPATRPRVPTTSRESDLTGPRCGSRAGWTLQAPLAPRTMQFYDRDWEYLGTKEGLAHELEQTTRIRAPYVTGAESFADACIANKMSWMAGR
ncbi:hypothetical protein DL770_004357 [Monosporascus sp. CRB-9-2]|nr:hypothetical protein DL770_004357 [Monosporascus sp. CRB-9-2]